jgi:hypothetical protein
MRPQIAAGSGFRQLHAIGPQAQALQSMFRFDHGEPRESLPSPLQVSVVVSVVYATHDRGNLRREAAGTPSAGVALFQANNGCLDRGRPHEHSIGQQSAQPIATADGSHGYILGFGGNLRGFGGRPGAEREFFFSRIGRKSRGLGTTASE